MSSTFKNELFELLNKHNVTLNLDISFVDDEEGNSTVGEVEIAVIDKETNSKVDTIGNFNYKTR